jgi:DNA replication protein DnaC
LVLIGNPGVGKTFLSKIVGWRACQSNQRVLFTTAMDMLNHLLPSQVDHSLVRKLKAYTEPALLICDERIYLPSSKAREIRVKRDFAGQNPHSMVDESIRRTAGT